MFEIICVFSPVTLDSEAADNAMGAFSFFNMIIFGVWSVVLGYNRAALTTTMTPAVEAGGTPEGSAPTVQTTSFTQKNPVSTPAHTEPTVGPIPSLVTANVGHDHVKEEKDESGRDASDSLDSIKLDDVASESAAKKH